MGLPRAWAVGSGQARRQFPRPPRPDKVPFRSKTRVCVIDRLEASSSLPWSEAHSPGRATSASTIEHVGRVSETRRLSARCRLPELADSRLDFCVGRSPGGWASMSSVLRWRSDRRTHRSASSNCPRAHRARLARRLGLPARRGHASLRGQGSSHAAGLPLRHSPGASISIAPPTVPQRICDGSRKADFIEGSPRRSHESSGFLELPQHRSKSPREDDQVGFACTVAGGFYEQLFAPTDRFYDRGGSDSRAPDQAR